LSEADRDAFEEHYFECPRCFDELETLQAIREELPRVNLESGTKATHAFVRWRRAAGLAAAVALAVPLLWMPVLWRRSTLPSGPSEATKAPSPSQQLPSTPTTQPPEPTAGSKPSLEQLARVEPPRYERVEPPLYEPQRLRNVPDEATKGFQRGMERYRRADYAGAIEDLRGAAELDPGAPHIRFFLGISHLMLGHDDAAIDRLRATIALGDSPYLQDAHFYLAKAFLRRNDLGAAESELKKIIQLGRGESALKARLLLIGIARLKQRSD
jgi:tetratricopeptide (TPR) repeat protein